MLATWFQNAKVGIIQVHPGKRVSIRYHVDTPFHEHCECCECPLHRTRPMEQRFQSTCPEIMMQMWHETKGVHGRPDMVLVGEERKD